MSDAEQEPSMEEILASIRRIISDDNEQVETTEEKPAVEEIVAQEEAVKAVEEPLPVEELPAPTPDEDEDEDEDDEVLDLTDMDAVAPEPLFEEQAYQAPVSPSPAPAPEPIQPPTPTPVEEKESLVSTPQAAETMDEFARLGSKLYEDVQELPIGNGAVTLEGLVRELVRPMLKEWLDQHLPITVERLVREEIERLVMQSQRKDPW
ncbi:DUF2497 domain-containing protein [Alphaproteobacteria bacterium]|nr:DUF2497 domain-containing protein [Alphaproteobacteria bacterium]